MTKHSNTFNPSDIFNNFNNDNFDTKNINVFIGVLSVLIAFWLVLYVIPGIFILLFHTLLGNIILLLLVIFIGMNNTRVGLIVFILVIILYQFSKQHVEGYQNGSENSVNSDPKTIWTLETIHAFLKYQNVSFPNTQFNMHVIQQQATEDEAKVLLSTGSWPWSQETQDLFKESIASNSSIKIDPGEALADAQKLYNEKAMQQLLSYDTKEGKFLLYGTRLGYSKGQPSFVPNKEKYHDTIKCAPDKDGNSYIEKSVTNGTNYFNGYKNITKEKIENADLPSEIPGFSFINGECNPCAALNLNADYSCPFKINVGGDNNTSSVWKTLWGL